MDDEILHYRSILAYNREVFLIEHGDLVKVFSAIDGNFKALIEVPRTKRDSMSKSYVSLIPFVLLLHRQARAAFEAFAVQQSYQAWVLLRPGLEALLIIGKWVDDPANAKIWQNRNEDRKSYRTAYSGQALRSTSLPSSDRIQNVLSKVNDDFVHANPDYYTRHLTVGAGDPGYVYFAVQYFDDDILQSAHVLASLHLLLVMQEALAGLLAHLFAVPVTLKAPLAAFLSQFGARMMEVGSQSEAAAVILERLGLVGWDNRQVPEANGPQDRPAGRP
jgi:hypothetical protein